MIVAQCNIILVPWSVLLLARGLLHAAVVSSFETKERKMSSIDACLFFFSFIAAYHSVQKCKNRREIDIKVNGPYITVLY